MYFRQGQRPAEHPNTTIVPGFDLDEPDELITL